MSKGQESSGNSYESFIPGELAAGGGGERLGLAASHGGGRPAGSTLESLDRPTLPTVRAQAPVTRSRYHADVQHRRRLQLPVGCLGLATLVISDARTGGRSGNRHLDGP